MSFDRARAIADAVLLEGYLLYPYRASSTKNQFRWTFGVLAPRGWSGAGGCEPWWMETQFLLASEGAARVEGRLRFLQLRRRRVEESANGGYREVGRLEMDGRAVIAFDESEVRELDFSFDVEDGMELEIPFSVPGGESVESVHDAAGTVFGRIRRESLAVEGSIRIRVDPARSAGPTLRRVTIRVENTTPWADSAAARDEALRASCLSSHLLLRAQGGSFVSLLDPPDWARDAVGNCRSTGAFPILAGVEGEDDLLLASPIVLYDHPRIAPESPGDLFDATEIDEILTLRTLTLTDEEKEEVRSTDDRGAAILERTESMPPEVFERLHGAFRKVKQGEMAPLAGEPSARESSAEEPSAEERFPPGSRVILRPGIRRTDAQDLLFAGRVATVEKVMRGIDGEAHLAVTIDDDPAAELHRWYGRFHYYAVDEVEALPQREG
ncbi:hypothetical protein [Vulgatibacter incomptus]|uniref:Uncharacterized protein n=1 Tax=Vulgatibacter incomptus TaxID=1391653 RepID=A0A0K1P9N7_9BACT|nr:hypothetical protein [Vulgatibacter incomptus]AKU90151.1 hypothetical protein AKJ08_0538 [Vulgatibacter incomptus]